MKTIPNRNTLWAAILVDELTRVGISAVYIAPGSRSTPLAMACDRQPALDVYLHHDERGAAFSALGMALVTQRPVALVCTSGTALANFYPAVLEAFYAQIPLVVLSADRPHELRGSGANQTMDQLKFFGEHVKTFVDVALPEAQPPAKVTRYLRTLIDRAVAASLTAPAGPVHLNLPFRKPFEPIPVPGDLPESIETDAAFFLDGRPNGKAFTYVAQGVPQPNSDQIDLVLDAIQQAERAAIVCGMRCPRADFPQAVQHLAAATGLPIFADAFSGVRFASHQAGSKPDLILGGYETFLAAASSPALPPPDLILHFGAAPISQNLNAFISAPLGMRTIMVAEHTRWFDETHTVDDVLISDPAALCRQVAARLEAPSVVSKWVAQLQTLEAQTWELIAAREAQTFSEGAVVAQVMRSTPAHVLVYVASSSAVRHVDQFARPRNQSLQVFSNRGLSGIDGTIASAIGASEGCRQRVTLIIGDVAFLHDLNSLSGLLRGKAKLTVILLNNDGGGIFQRLPIRNFEPPFERLFITPHGLTFQPAASLFGLRYTLANSQQSVAAAYQQSLQSTESHLIEIPCDSAAQEKIRQVINKR